MRSGRLQQPLNRDAQGAEAVSGGPPRASNADRERFPFGKFKQDGHTSMSDGLAIRGLGHCSEEKGDELHRIRKLFL